MKRWSFHAVALASGAADEELAAKKELLARLRADATLSSWQRSCSYRVVGRAQLEELVRATHAEEAEARRREERQEAAGVGEGDAAEEEKEDLKAVAVTPALLALAFQRFVARDKREFLAYQQPDSSGAVEGGSGQVQSPVSDKETHGAEDSEGGPDRPPARMYLLVDYPTSLAEVTALLRLGEVGGESQVADGPENLPLLPLIDGVVLLADPTAIRGRNRSSSTNGPRSRGGSVIKTEGATSRMSVMETTVFQTSNAVVKVFYEAAQVGGIEWSDFTFTNLVSKEYLTPRAEAAAAACVPLSAGQLESVATQSWSMYPADHSVVRLCQTSRGLIWLTVYLHGETFGLRSEYRTPNGGIGMEFTDQHLGKSSPALERNIQFIASFQDESTLQITEGTRRLPKKPDQFPTIAATNSFPNGLIVSACSDGSIIQRCCHSKRNIKTKSAYNTSSDANNAGVQYGEESEAFRVIYGRGSVLRALQCGRKEVLLANGVTRVVQDCKKHRHNSRKRPCNDSELPPPPVTTLTVDPETNALVERRPNGVIIVTLTSGARVAYHVDGTRMYSNAGNTHVLVKKRGFADVCIDVDVNVTAQHHAAGERVAVTKGGLRVRSVVDVYDGTHVEISYNTKVTAQVNGRVTTRKPGGQVIVAKDSGRVEYSSQQPGSAPNPNGSDTKDDDDRDVTSHNGVYYFDCRRGRFQLCDSEQNQFHVDFCGTDEEEGPTIAVDLAGVVSDAEAARYEVDTIPAKAVINEPIPPYVFVLNGDGTGLEILRPQDIAEYLEGVASENQVGEIVDTGYSTTRNHVFLCQLRDSKCPKPLLNDAKLHGEMVALQQPVATAAKYLPSYFAEVKDTSPLQQFTTVRRVQQIQPLSADELAEMHAGWAMWEQWQKEREANKECYKVVDPRQPEVIAQEVAMQKKVLAAYKATRARKKMARQKAREMKARNVPQELSPGMRMETVQEGEEALGGEGEDDDESDDEFGQFGSDMSDDDIGETAEVDDPMELLWSAFSQADTEGRGLLSIAQTRLGVVNVLGIGVTANELTEALVRFKIPYPFNVSFDVFTDLVAFFRSGDESNQDSEGHNSEQGDHIPSLKGMVPAQRKGHGTPRGSAAEAIRARNHDSASKGNGQ
ncbi:hypothetical protein PR002_g9435 [Phytophthora rubi]|uniref:Uncharacterized protein n=1 Tax=Phytophthora rubi TaxID=129364 RepID=A0A6A3MKA7_9STRA|nr:hypothetical protein PR002_g9435 [Phytophthora rubi]